MVLHAVVLLVLLHRPEPIFVAPSFITHGDGEKSYHLVYTAPAGDVATEQDNARISLRAAVRKRKQVQVRQKARPNVLPDSHEGEASDHSALAGTRFGSLMSGPSAGPEVRPALPVVFPDPPVSRAELPAGLQGDVIVEVTIDTRGAIVDMKMLQGIGHGIDEKVLATLQNWRYTPATMDGVPISSKHDVRFHFPG